MIGIGIGQYKPSGLRDWEKILVGIAGLKHATEDPLISAVPSPAVIVHILHGPNPIFCLVILMTM